MLSLSLRRPFLGTVRPFLTRGLLNEPPSKAGMGEIDPDRKKGQPKEGEAFVAPKLQKKMLGSDKNLGGRPAGVDGDGGGDRTAGAGESSGMRKVWSDPQGQFGDEPHSKPKPLKEEITHRTAHPKLSIGDPTPIPEVATGEARDVKEKMGNAEGFGSAIEGGGRDGIGAAEQIPGKERL